MIKEIKNLVFLLCLIISASLHAQTFSDNGLDFKVIDETAKTCKVTGYTGGDSLVIPETVNGYTVIEIDNGAFFRMTELTTVELPVTLQKIGTTAFIGCTGLHTIKLPKSLQTIGIGAFAECLSLTELIVDPENPYFTSENGIVYNKNKRTIVCAAAGLSEFTIAKSVATVGNCAFFGCRNLTKLTLPTGVSLIENSAFNACSSLSEINIPGSVYEIGASAFSGCTSLTSVDIPARTAKIGAGAFGACTSLTDINIHPDNYTFHSVNGLVLNHDLTSIVICPGGVSKVEIPETVSRIAGSSFNGCVKLENLNIPSTVTSIGSYAFINCISLKTVIIPEGIQVIEPYTFQGCAALSNVILPSTVTEIRQDAFLDCKSLSTIGFPSGVETIKAFAFKNCTNLNKIVFGQNVSTIEMQSFQNCDNVETVICYNMAVPSLSDTAFDDVVFRNARLYVDPGVIDEYKSAKVWSKFHISEVQSNLVTAIVLDRNEYSGEPGQSFVLTATLYPLDATNQLLEWSSDNIGVAIVDETGEVHLIAKGICEITATSVDNPNVKASCRVVCDNSSGIDAIISDDSIDIEEIFANIYNLQGSLVKSRMAVSQISQLPSGVYIIKCINDARKILIR